MRSILPASVIRLRRISGLLMTPSGRGSCRERIGSPPPTAPPRVVRPSHSPQTPANGRGNKPTFSEGPRISGIAPGAHLWTQLRSSQPPPFMVFLYRIVTGACHLRDLLAD